MRRLAVIGDVHDRREALDAAMDLAAGPFDLAILSGDVGLDPPWDEVGRLTARESHDASMGAVVGRVARRMGCPVVFVPGNHDLRDAIEIPGALNLDGVVRECAGLRLAGLGGAGPDRFGFPYEWSEEQAERRLAALPATPRIDLLLCHTPPAGTSLDLTGRGAHVGSNAVARAIARLAPRLFVCGHIHEARGFEVLDGIPCLNAGALAPPAEQIQLCLVDWDEGPVRIERRQHPPGPPRETLYP